MSPSPLILPHNGVEPDISPTAWIAPNATVIGAATIRERASIWFGAVIRADSTTIHIGAGSNVQDGCVLHADPGVPLDLGNDVAVGHLAVLHGCTIEDGVLVGMNATILNGAHIGSGSLIAAGAVVLEGTTIPTRSLVAGVPAKIRRSTTDDEVAMIAANAAHYRQLALDYD